MKKSQIFLIYFFLFNLARGYTQEGYSGQPGAFLRYGVSAEALAMGRAYTAFTNDANAIYWNPGGLGGLYRNGVSLSLTRADFFEDTRMGFIGLAYPFNKFLFINNLSIGCGILSFCSGTFKKYDEYGDQVENFYLNMNENALYISPATIVNIKNAILGVGFSYKYIGQNMFNSKTSGQGWDFGIQTIYLPWAILRPFKFGIMLRDINQTKIKNKTSKYLEIINQSSKFGLVFEPGIWLKILRGLSIALDFDLQRMNHRKREWFLGGQYKCTNWIPIQLNFGWDNEYERVIFGFTFDFNRIHSSVNKILPDIHYLASDFGYPKGLNRGEKWSIDWDFHIKDPEEYYENGFKKFTNNIDNTTNRITLGALDFEKVCKAADNIDNYHKILAYLRLGDIEVLSNTDPKRVIYSTLYLYKNGLNYLNHEKLNENDIKDKYLNQLSYQNYIQMHFLKHDFENKWNKDDSNYLLWQTLVKSMESDTLKYLEAYRMYEIGDYDLAFEKLKSIKNVDYPYKMFLLGIINLVKLQYYEAIEEFKKIIHMESKPSNRIFVPRFQDCNMVDDAHFFIGVCYCYLANKADLTGDVKTASLLSNRATFEFSKIAKFYPNSKLIINLQDITINISNLEDCTLPCYNELIKVKELY